MNLPTPKLKVPVITVLSEETEKLSPFHNVKPCFSTKPIPKRFLFPMVSNFLIQMDSIGYDDSRYANKRLFGHFTSFHPQILSMINEIEALRKTSQEQLNNAYSRNLTPYVSTIIPGSEDLWRKRVILSIKQNKLIKKIHLEKISYCNYGLEILRKLKDLCEELIYRPRIVFLNNSALTRISYHIRYELCFKEQIKLKSVEANLKDIKNMSRYIPKPFSKPESFLNVVESIIISAGHLRDPVTQYLPESMESYIFSDFLRSRFSPIRYAENSNEPIESIIELTIDMMKSFVNIKSKDHISTLSSFSSRHWFNKYKVCNKYFFVNQKLVLYLERLSKQTISELKPPKILSKVIQVAHTPRLFFESEQIIVQSLSMMAYCMFMTVPVDIANYLFQIHLCFAGFIAIKLGKSCNEKQANESLSFLWFLLFLSTDVPFIDSIFFIVEKWHKADNIPTFIVEKLKLPRAVLNDLIKHSKSK